MEEVRKPVTIERVEFISSLLDLINNSRLPAFVIETILRDAYNDVHTLAQRQYEADLERYKEAIASKQ